ncbi:hypothetical protein GCM10022256_11500 [Frondihabitans peucedani]|uniref:Uncharacterized protein n=1 Tax=Frondihabitans peucedani TaxID=598626 RepID=A0ABP8DZY9_9MICO
MTREDAADAGGADDLAVDRRVRVDAPPHAEHLPEGDRLLECSPPDQRLGSIAREEHPVVLIESGLECRVHQWTLPDSAPPRVGRPAESGTIPPGRRLWRRGRRRVVVSAPPRLYC